VTVHVIGAGLAGLGAALAAACAGTRVVLHEATGQAGGRCRSFHDRVLDRVIDNGTHVVLGANAATRRYLRAIGGEGAMSTTAPARFDFLDLASGESWSIAPPFGRVPGARPRDWARVIRLPFAARSRSVKQALDGGDALYRRLWEPLAIAALNVDPAKAPALDLARLVGRLAWRGERGWRASLAEPGLSAALVEPALATLAELGVETRFNHRLTGLDGREDRVETLAFGGERMRVDEADRVILAVPWHAAIALDPRLDGGGEAQPVVNAHFKLPAPRRGVMLLGLLGGLAQWLMVRGDVASVTLSAAAEIDDRDETLLARLWRDVALTLSLPREPAPSGRLLVERRATLASTLAKPRRRPRSPWGNMLIAGDWIAPEWPCTIEAALRSGEAAGRAATAR
jgi:squalene-associated FAD-dependent desaturase